jgi:hypothetical protein
VPTTGDVQDIAFKHGRAKKRSNAAVAVLTGAFPGILLTCFLRHDWPRWLIGFAIGLIWANGFEYSYHRWLLHRPRSNFSKGHLVHHSTLGAPEEAEHVTFAEHSDSVRQQWNCVARSGYTLEPQNHAGGVGGMDGLPDARRGDSLANSHAGMAAARTALRARLSFRSP